MAMTFPALAAVLAGLAPSGLPVHVPRAALTPRCQAALDAWCNSKGACPIDQPSFEPKPPSTSCPGPLVALNSTADPAYDGRWGWRCYSPSGLDPEHTRYHNGTCYCSRQGWLEHQLCLCQHPSTPGTCGPPPPPLPPPPPPPPPPTNPEPQPPGTTVFAGGTEGYDWYFFPQLVVTPAGDLIVFSE